MPRFTAPPTGRDIELVHKTIKPYIRETPVMTSKSLNELAGCELYFKCENFQTMGSFKTRGAVARMAAISDEERKRGVFTSSSGNFGVSFAYACGLVGVKPLVSVPSVASEIKKRGVKRLGAILYNCGPTLATRMAAE